MAYAKKRIFVTDTDMSRDGQTPYKVVLSVNPSKEELFAKEELIRLFEAATGAVLPVVCDKDVSYDVFSYYFSIGKTSLFEEVKKDGVYVLEKPFDIFGDSVKLYSKGNMIFFNGSGKGTIFAVYEFLKIVFNYKYFAPDEWSIDTKNYSKVHVLDVEYYPSIARRSTAYIDSMENPEIYRSYLGNTLYSGWIEHCHTYFRILPKEIYYAKHPDWYSPSGNNLCLSNKEMRKEFIKRVEQIIDEKDGTLFMLGQEDTMDFCSCEKCRKKILEDGTPSGLVMEFSNEVATIVGKWLKENHPERQVKFVVFAYNMTCMPPVRFDQVKGKYVPLNKNVIAVPNLSVMVIPYNAIYSAPFMDEEKNPDIVKQIQGWQEISKDLMSWTYYTVFDYDEYMLPFNFMDNYTKNIKTLSEAGVSFLYNEDISAHKTKRTHFEELRNYIMANSMWNADCDVQSLIKDFTDAYYKEAAPCMRLYLKTLNDRMYFNEEQYQKYAYAFDCFKELIDAKYWPKQFVLSLDEIFETAYQSIKKSDKREILKNRLDKEYLLVRYIKIKIHSDEIKDLENEKKSFNEDCLRLGIRCTL